MYEVKLAPADAVIRPVRTLSLFRYWAISVLYVAAFAIAVLALGMYLFSPDSSSGSHWKAFLGLFCAGAGFGGYLKNVDRRERQNVEREESFNLLREEAVRYAGDTTLQTRYQTLLAKRAGLKVE